jgi:hypothetical protein
MEKQLIKFITPSRTGFRVDSLAVPAVTEIPDFILSPSFVYFGYTRSLLRNTSAGMDGYPERI